ncbi:MAG: hypothetical protein GY943_26065 [Chloroflexi bacterium]|nr:hypothetical protein [Chloroflexota bacterium]
MKVMGKWVDGLVVALSVIAALFVFSVLAVSAHAYLAESFPRNGEQLSTSPIEVSGTFTQELVSGDSTMRVFDADGNQVDNGDGGVDLFDPDHKSMLVTVPEDLPDGSYVVEWVVLSAEDDDTTEGAFVFGIGTDALASVTDVKSEGASIGWWVGGSIAALIIGLLAAMLLLTRQPAVRLESEVRM